MKSSHRARKRFGQNFLRDISVIHRIVDAIHPLPEQHLVEIGPGQGALTEALLESGCRLDVIELDRDLIPELQSRFGDNPRFRLHAADALQFDYSDIGAANARLRLFGNLPYNISTPLLFHLLRYAERIEDLHFMLQREVVQRLTARPGSKTWGKLGVMTRFHCETEALFEVSPEAFRPRPRVVSAVVRLTPHPGPRDPALAARLRRVVSAAFSQRRKTLRNTLRDIIDVQQLEKLAISPTARAETLTLEQFIAISEAVGPGTEQE